MDVLIYLCILAVIGLFFFLSLFPEKNKTPTPYLFILFFTSMFFILQMISSPYVDVGTNVTVVKDSSGAIIGSIIEPIKEPIGRFNYVLLLANTAFFALAAMQLGFNKGKYLDEDTPR